MRRLLMVLVIVAVTVSIGNAGVVGKDGSTLPDRDSFPATTHSAVRAVWEWNSAGSIDAAATTGGSSDGWGTHFLATTVNDSGDDMRLVELGWPCAGVIPGAWLVWVGGSMPADYSNPDYTGSFTAVDTDDTQLPPPTYTYVDVTAANVVVPRGETVWLAYVNPGVGGQIDFNGVDTWGWYGGAWDPDQTWGRTAVMQLKGDPMDQPTPTPNPNAANPVPTLSGTAVIMLMVVLAGLGVAILIRRR